MSTGYNIVFLFQIFCELAYKASTRQDLLDGMDEFMDDLRVLPPSIWDPTSRLSPPKKVRSTVNLELNNVTLKMPRTNPNQTRMNERKLKNRFELDKNHHGRNQ